LISFADDRVVAGLDEFITEAEARDRARGQVLDYDVGAFSPRESFRIAADRLLVLCCTKKSAWVLARMGRAEPVC
jgi:hypothetical protein